VLLSLCSFGLYQFYWFYKNWQYVKEHERAHMRVAWRVLASHAWFPCNCA
jgi:hypothetical protein